MSEFRGILTDLPDIVLEKVFSFLTYDNIAQNRVVCRKFNELGGKMLNKGYYMADRYHGKTLRSIKAKLPRRESERRVHPLARQCDILIAIETRLSMLSMTFSKWMDANLCCFIPGKVIDEIMRVLRCVANNPSPPRAHEILQELRDISSMAMEHFDEKILPTLKMSMHCPSFLSNQKKKKFILDSGTTDHFVSTNIAKFMDGISVMLPRIKVKVANGESLIARQRAAKHLFVDNILGPELRFSSQRTFVKVDKGKSRTDDEILPTASKKSPTTNPLAGSAGVTLTEFNKLIVRESINRKKIKAQGELIAKQAHEISELRRHVEEWEAKWRDLFTNLNKSKELPTLPSTSAATPSHAPKRKVALAVGEEVISTKKRKTAETKKDK